MKAKPAPDPVADPDVTQDWSGPHVATDPGTEQLLPGGRIPASVAKRSARPPKPPWWQDGKVLAAAGAGALLLLLLGIWVIIRDKDGKEVAWIQLPEGGSVTQEPIPTRPAPVLEKPGHQSEPAVSEPQPLPPWHLPPGSPPPAIAPFHADQAKRHQESWAEHLGLPVEFENSIGMKLVLIPPGEFMVGSPKSDSDATDREDWGKPQHTVRITKPFYLGKMRWRVGRAHAGSSAATWSRSW